MNNDFDLLIDDKPVAGWLYRSEAQLLYTLAGSAGLPGCIVEIGSYQGKSTIMLASAAKECGRKVYAIDPHMEFDNGVDHYGAQDRAAFLDNVVRSGLSATIVPVGLPSDVVAQGWQERIGLLFIDGAHEYEAVKTDIENWVHHVGSGGYIAFHDTGHESVSRALNEFLDNHPSYKVVAREDSMTVLQAPVLERIAVRPDVSVLIPCYNAAETVQKAILSALDQQGVSVEVIICEDACTDNSHEVLMDVCGSSNGRADFIKHVNNQGLAAALNTTAENASGRYLIELDADDTLAPGCLAAMVKALDEHPEIGFVYGQTQYHGDAEILYTPPPYRREDFNQAFVSLYAFMYRREAWDAGCRYRATTEIDGRKITIQDWDMALQLQEHMRYEGLALPNVKVLDYTYKKGSLTDFTLQHQLETLAAFKQRWPMVTTTRI